MKKFIDKVSKKIRKQSSDMAPNISSGQTLGYKEKTRDMDIFHKAALQGDMRKLQLTSICGDVNKPDKFNRTALHLACANGHAEVVSFLIGKKAKINLCDDQKRTALMTAVQCKNDIIVSILLENNANPDLVDLDGNTALHLASKIPSMESVILLVKKDAAINTKNLKGLSPLAMAIRGNHIAMAEFLLKKGADVDILDKHQRSPLMIAAGNGHMDMVRMLLMFKADFTLKDNKGLSAEDYALTNEHRPCALLISEHAAKRYPGPFLSPSVKCEEIVKPERVNSREASNTWGEPSTSKDGLYSPIAECIDTRREDDMRKDLQPKGANTNQWGMLWIKSEVGSLSEIDSYKSSIESLSGCMEDFQAKEFPELTIPSIKEESIDMFSNAPLAPQTTISPDDKNVPASPSRPPLKHYGPNIIFQESEESDWDQDSLISFCQEFKTNKLQKAVQEGSPEMSIIESDDEGSFHSNMQQQKTVLPETWDEKSGEEEEDKAAFSVVVQNVMIINDPAKSFSMDEENHDEPKEESGEKKDMHSICFFGEPNQLEIASEDSVVESAENSLKEKTLDDCQLPEKTVLQGAEELMSTEEPQLHLTEMESCVVSGTAGQNTSDETKVGMCQSIKLEEPEVPPETSKTMKHPSASRDTGEKASEELANQQLETKLLSPRELLGEPSQQLHQYVPSRIKVESQLPPEQTFHIRPGGHLEDNSQLPMVSEALGPRFPQNNGGITDLSMRDRTLSDLLKDDCRWKSAEWPKRTRTPILNNDDSEISEDSDKLLSEDSDFAHNIQGLETTDSRSKMNFQDKVNQRFLKAKCYLGSAGERLRQLEIDKRILEETNLELQTDNTNLTIQLKTAITNIVAYESANKKLEEDYRQAQSIVVQNQSTLSLLHQKVNSLVSKQKEMEEECRRSKSNEEQLRSELEEFQADSNIKQRDLSEENETLKDEVENLHQDLTISRDNENQNALHWNNTITSLKYELQMVNTQLETERQAQDHLVGELQSIRSRLAEGEQARLDMEKALLLEKDENQRLTSQAGCHLETVNKLSEKLSKLKAHSNTMESDVHRYEVQMAEKTTQLNNVQRENEQTSLRVKELETALQAEKELLVRATSRQETTQALLNQAQNEGTSLRQRLEEATAIAVAKENALSEAKKSFNDSMFKLRTECEERVQKAQCTYTELACKVPELESLVRKLEQEKTERQAHLKQLQQELDDSLKKLSKCEASLEFHARYRSDYEEEKTRLLRDVDKLKTKLHEKDTQCIQAEKLINERASILDERERELSFAARKNKDAQAAVDASNNVAKQLEEDMRRLELDNIRLEAAAKQHSNKFGALQRAAEEDARMRVQLEDLVTNLQSRKLTLEDQLNREVQKHSALSNNAQDTQFMWEEELKNRSKLGLRLAELEKEKDMMHTLVDTEKKKWEELAEHKKAAECRLEQEMKRNSDLQREIYRLQTLLKAAKKKLQEQQFSVAEREKLNQQVHELQAELEREQFSFNQLERSKKQLEDDLLNLRRTQAPTLDGGFMGLAANPLGYQYRCHCPKSFNPVSEGPSYSVQDYLAKMRQDLDIAMSRELGNSSVKLDMALTCVSPVTKARQQYVTALKKNREV
ncbi:ankyrin repeat domain-containing protein 26-like isoform X2 [Corythoichthys intestinalis]|uniref:ankyrin repeat domain-containing protein 26-like isoform X2 n=1 Tax=Corythoichthys intestinalis TaxID=161448 RepID=UPI0025A58041|nr:ankyrin repeat domain-containing protein 26-like isoform X2 [Corythoichthys intestinalis]